MSKSLLQSPKNALRFFIDVLGLIETARRGQSVYLRAWRNFFHHDLVLTEGKGPGLGHIGWRTAGAEALETAVSRLKKCGAGIGWREGEPGRPRGYRYEAGADTSTKYFGRLNDGLHRRNSR